MWRPINRVRPATFSARHEAGAVWRWGGGVLPHYFCLHPGCWIFGSEHTALARYSSLDKSGRQWCWGGGRGL